MFIYFRKPISKKPPAAKKPPTVLEPYWILDLIYTAGSYLEFEQDNSQAEMRKNKKLKWFADIERYKKAVLIRYNNWVVRVSLKTLT